MTEIKLRADEARQEAAHVQSEAASAKEQIARLRGRLDHLADSFTGQTAIAFDGSFNEWRTNADSMLDSLTELGTFLNNAADTIEATDMQIANSLQGR